MEYGLNGFFGRLWKKVKGVMGTIIGTLVGGPIGGFIGQAIQSLLDGDGGTITFGEGGGFGGESGTNESNPNGRLNNTYTIEAVQDEFPISSLEEAALLNYFKVFGQSIAMLANSVDTEINVAVSRMKRGQIAAVNPFVVKANQVLLAISKFRTHNAYILKNGLKDSIVPRSENYIINRTNFTEHYLKILEKAVFKYVKDNVTGFALVEKRITYSGYEIVAKNKINWGGNSVTGIVQRYAVKTESTEGNTSEGGTNTGGNTSGSGTNTGGGSSTETEVEVIDTDTNSGGAATNGGDPTDVVITKNIMSPFGKLLLVFGIGYVVSKATNKPSKTVINNK